MNIPTNKVYEELKDQHVRKVVLYTTPAEDSDSYFHAGLYWDENFEKQLTDIEIKDLYMKGLIMVCLRDTGSGSADKNVYVTPHTMLTDRTTDDLIGLIFGIGSDPNDCIWVNDEAESKVQDYMSNRYLSDV